MKQVATDNIEIATLEEEKVCIDLVKRASDFSDRLKKCIQVS